MVDLVSGSDRSALLAQHFAEMRAVSPPLACHVLRRVRVTTAAEAEFFARLAAPATHEG